MAIEGGNNIVFSTRAIDGVVHVDTGLLAVNSLGEFSKTNLTSDTLSTVWDFGIPIYSNQSVADFDMTLIIKKVSSGTTAVLTFESMQLQQNIISTPQSLTFYGYKTDGTQRIVIGDETTDIAKNALKILNGNLYINFSYIIQKQAESEPLITPDSFLVAADYEITIYASNLSIQNANTLSEDLTLTKWRTVSGSTIKTITYPIGSNKISGTIQIQ
jgi:hypothetical protein